MPTTCPNLLCAVDFSRRSRSALIHAAALADHFRARLRVIIAAPGRDAESETLRIETWLRRFVYKALGGDPVAETAELIVRSGVPGEAILSACEEERPDLIVISTHGHSVPRRAYGSTTAHVLARASTPVLVVPARVQAPSAPRAERLLSSARVILAPIDFHVRGVHDARIAAGLADAFGLPLILLHVLEPGTPITLDEANAGLQFFAAALRLHVPVEILVTRGEPALEISRVALERKAGVVVMGLRGELRGAESPPGSIAHSVLRHAPVPVIALPAALERSFHQPPGHRAGDVAARS